MVHSRDTVSQQDPALLKTRHRGSRMVPSGQLVLNTHPSDGLHFWAGNQMVDEQKTLPPHV